MAFPTPHDVEYTKKLLNEITDNLLELEEKWRKLATFLQERKADIREFERKGEELDASFYRHAIVYNFNTDLLHTLFDIHKKYSYLNGIAYSILRVDEDLFRKSSSVLNALRSMETHLAELQKQLDSVLFHIKDYDEQYERGRKALSIMQAFCKDVEDALGRKVCFFDYSNPRERTFPASANDISSAFHRMAEELVDVKNKLTHLIGERRTKRTYVREGASKATINMCSTFEKAVEWMYSQGLVADADDDVQLCIASSDEAMMRLGSSPGHGAHVYADGRLEYYDTDQAVNRTMKTILERYANCSCDVKPTGVVCTNCDPIKASALISLAVSMDIRENYDEDIKRAKELLKDVLYL